MIRIAITPAAFEAIAATLPLGSVGYENATNEKGQRLVWLEPRVVDRLKAMRGPGETPRGPLEEVPHLTVTTSQGPDFKALRDE
jgi:hypothetical protein